MHSLSHASPRRSINAQSVPGFEQSLAQAALRRVEAKEFVFVEGDPMTHLFRIETGAIALYKILSDGRRQIVGFAYAGDLIGLGGEGEHVMNAQAIKPTRLRCLPIATLHRSASKDAAFACKLYEALTRELTSTREVMLITGQRSAMERVAGFLLAFSRRNQRNGRDPADVELPMTRADIGDFLGLTIETVSRTFSKLKALRMIDLPQSNHVKLLDLDELERLAEGGDEAF
jgi:CRP/FNR family transcriptional regulator, anaerobic regulatory protein